MRKYKCFWAPSMLWVIEMLFLNHPWWPLLCRFQKMQLSVNFCIEKEYYHRLPMQLHVLPCCVDLTWPLTTGDLFESPSWGCAAIKEYIETSKLHINYTQNCTSLKQKLLKCIILQDLTVIWQVKCCFVTWQQTNAI